MGSPDPPRPPQFAALNFIDAIWNQGSLSDAWPHTDPSLRLCLAQMWLMPIRQRALDDGYPPDEVVAALARDDPDHLLWPDFQRSIVRNLRSWGALGNDDLFRFGALDRPVGVDTEVLHLYPVSEIVDGAMPPGRGSGHVFLMAYRDHRWRVLNLSSAVVPEPGWPPKLR